MLRPGEDLAGGDFEIAHEAAPHETSGGELVRHTCIEPNAGEIEEKASLDFSRIDHTVATAERYLEGRLGIEGNTDLARETIARSARHDPQRCFRERERGSDFVHRAVAAPRHAQRRAAPHRRHRQLTRVAAALGDEHLSIDAAAE